MRESRRRGGQRGRWGPNRVLRLVGHSKDSVFCSKWMESHWRAPTPSDLCSDSISLTVLLKPNHKAQGRSRKTGKDQEQGTAGQAGWQQ